MCGPGRRKLAASPHTAPPGHATHPRRLFAHTRISAVNAAVVAVVVVVSCPRRASSEREALLAASIAVSSCLMSGRQLTTTAATAERWNWEPYFLETDKEQFTTTTTTTTAAPIPAGMRYSTVYRCGGEPLCLASSK